MYKANVEIETIVPYQHDMYTDEAQKRADTGTPNIKETWQERQEKWKEKVYKDNNGCYMPVTHIYHSLINGLSGQPCYVSNKVKITRKVAQATVFIEEEKIYIKNGKVKKNYDEMHTHSTINRNAIGNPRITTGKPRFNPPCTMNFTVCITQDFLLPEILRDALARAGQCYGIGAGRPIFGRFIVKKFEVVK